MRTISLTRSGGIPAECYPCMCGAVDCKSCHPESFEEIQCAGCGEVTIYLDAEENGWRELEGDNYCSHCIAELERASKEDPERVLN